jgi:hypothetical protein
MKKALLVCAIITISYLSFGQIRYFEINSSKQYPDNTWTAYLELDTTIQNGMQEVITDGIILNPQVKNFSFYNKFDLSKCMFTADISIEAEDIIDMINEIVLDNVDYVSKTFVNVWISENKKEILFQIEDIASDLQRRQIEEVLMKDELIINAVVNGDDCKIITTGNFTPEYIQTTLDRFGVIISPASIK